jgi:hypothetical protein
VKAPPPSVMSESDVNLFDSRADLLEKDVDDSWMFGSKDGGEATKTEGAAD